MPSLPTGTVTFLFTEIEFTEIEDFNTFCNNWHASS